MKKIRLTRNETIQIVEAVKLANATVLWLDAFGKSKRKSHRAVCNDADRAIQTLQSGLSKLQRRIDEDRI